MEEKRKFSPKPTLPFAPFGVKPQQSQEWISNYTVRMEYELNSKRLEGV